MLSLFLLLFGLFFWSVNITKWHILIKKADAIEPQKQVQYTASTVDKMKIEPAVISFMENTIPSKMVDKNDDFIVLQIYLCILKVPNGCQEVRMQATHKKIQFFFSHRVKLNSSSRRVFVLFWSSLWFFSRLWWLDRQLWIWIPARGRDQFKKDQPKWDKIIMQITRDP